MKNNLQVGDLREWIAMEDEVCRVIHLEEETVTVRYLDSDVEEENYLYGKATFLDNTTTYKGNYYE